MNGTILLVDDNSMFIEIEKEFLQSSSVEILTAKDGQEAMQVIRKKRPDLIFMDYQMPKMDGVECCRKIKSDTSLSTIPVVMVTSKGNEEDKNNSYSAGCDNFLTKPLDRDFFLSIARSFLPGINRRGQRLQTSLTGEYRVNNESKPCTIHDLGIGGAFLSTDYFGIPKSIVQLTFTLPNGVVVDCHGRIVWVNRYSALRPVGFGVQFALLPKHAEKALADLIKDGV